MRPWALTGSKAFLPLVQRGADGALTVRSALEMTLSDLLSVASVKSVCVVSSSSQRSSVKELVDGSAALRGRVDVVVQRQPRGLGDAVFVARGHVPRGVPFMLVLGDHLFTHAHASDGGAACIAALLRAASSLPAGAGLTAAGTCTLAEVPANGLLASGARFGSSGGSNAIYSVRHMVEKPAAAKELLADFASDAPRMAAAGGSLDETPSRAATLFPYRYLCNFGIDILPWDTFDVLADMRRAVKSGNAKRAANVMDGEGDFQEVGLREAQKALLQENRLYLCNMEDMGFLRHDIGNPDAYWAALQHLSGSRAERNELEGRGHSTSSTTTTRSRLR
jgi:UTP-glucose-1-phosphate uridylyltransferase